MELSTGKRRINVTEMQKTHMNYCGIKKKSAQMEIKSKVREEVEGNTL